MHLHYVFILMYVNDKIAIDKEVYVNMKNKLKYFSIQSPNCSRYYCGLGRNKIL